MFIFTLFGLAWVVLELVIRCDRSLKITVDELAKVFRTRIFETSFKILKTAKNFVYYSGDRSRWFTACIGTHNRSEQGVIKVSATVVANCSANAFRQSI